MILLPAVDIRDGKAVRLRQGRFDEETVYADEPFEAARSFVEAGARFLHLVDLDGAREGEPVNLRHVERIAKGLPVPVELGGSEGIGLLEGPVTGLEANGRKVPQIGWNHVAWRRRSPLVEGLPDPC
ncbi:MAG TPA: HisA/HisF-related TIM barrel protein, partial [Thermoleophilaceae bacterium]|nr:HisA/HisF-related TIM barrel protein [Thermoleophilaceae bacterium]